MELCAQQPLPKQMVTAACFDPPSLSLAASSASVQPNKKLRKNKSFADGIMEVALDTKRAVRWHRSVGCSWVLRCVHHPAASSSC